MTLRSRCALGFLSLTGALLTGCGGGAVGADGKTSSALDRRAPDQQREFARIVDGYFQTRVWLSKEMNTGNPIKDENGRVRWEEAKGKLWSDLAGLMSKTGGKFDGWIGTLSFDMGGPSPVGAERLRAAFAPDGIPDRDDTGKPYQTSFILFRSHPYAVRAGAGTSYPEFEDTRPLLSSPFAQSQGAIDVKRKVKASGELIMGGYPEPNCTANGKAMAFHCAGGEPDGGSTPYPIVVKLAAVSQL